METVAIGILGRVALNAGLACAVLFIGSGSPSNVYAASSTATASATVVAPIAITASNPHLRFQSVYGVGDLIVTGSGALSFAIIVQRVTYFTTGGDVAKTMEITGHASSPSATGALMAGTQTLVVAARLTQATARLAGLHTANFSVTVACD
jgi:hypothetical protein